MLRKSLFFLLFAVAFALIESVVVVYLRELYYPEGFAFPMKVVPIRIAVIELLRETATMGVLVSIAWLAGSRFYSRLAWFLIAFGVWDIFYYIWLKVLLGWPESLLTWDLLFLIPIPWVGPVLSPVLVSVSFILFGVLILYRESRGEAVAAGVLEWGMLLGGAGLIFVSYIYDHAIMLYQCEEFLVCSADYLPTEYGWSLFALGELLMVLGACRSLKKCGAR